MRFHVYRDCDARRLRKVVIEIYDKNGILVDRARMFAGWRFAARLHKKKLRMLLRAAVMLG
jgi:hypothetical protein